MVPLRSATTLFVDRDSTGDPDEPPAVAHVEIDMDANPEVAKRLSVMSLPTTLIFDADGRPRYRTSAFWGVDVITQVALA